MFTMPPGRPGPPPFYPVFDINKIKKVDMTRIVSSNFPSFHRDPGAAPPATNGIAGPPHSAGARQSASAGAITGKRPLGTEDYLANASQRARKKSPAKIVKSAIEESVKSVKSAIEQSMTEHYKNACKSLVEQLCQKIPVPNNEWEAACRKEEAEKLVGKWVTCATYIPHINTKDLGTQRKLILTRMLAKIVRSGAGTYEEACDELRTASLSGGNPVEYLTRKAQAYCRDLEETDATLPRLPTDAYGCMALIALHEELELQGYRLADLVGIASKPSNFSAMLLLASDIMNQPPFTSGSGGDELSEADRALSSIARKVQIARCRGAFQSFVAVRAHFPALRKIGFSPQYILDMASHDSVAPAIEAVAVHGAELRKKGFTPAQIATIASHAGGPRNIQLTLKYADALLEKKVSRNWIAQTLSRHEGKEKMESKLQLKLQLHAEKEQRWTDAEMASLYAFANTATGTGPGADGGGAQEMLRDAVSQNASSEALIEPVPHAEPADVEKLRKILMANDGELLAALMDAAPDLEPIPFAEAEASADQVVQDLVESGLVSVDEAAAAIAALR
jgi:hypothetical protein